MIEITQYKNAVKINEKGDVDCEIKHPIHGWIPFTLNLDDKGTDIDIKKLLDRMVMDKQLQEYQEPSEDQVIQKKAVEVRMMRDELLRNDVDPVVSIHFA